MAVQLGIWEYVIFSITICVTILIGGYRIYKDKVKNTELDYFLFAKKTTGLVPIILSSFATFTSGISLLTIPTEAYIGGITAIHMFIAALLASVVVSKSMTSLAVICTVYTALGGFKTVVWTDTFQAVLMIATVVLVATKGLIDIGGFGVLWERMYSGDRATFAYFTSGPTVRYTVWSLYAGHLIGIVYLFTDQIMVQRQLASKTLKSAQLSLYVSCIGIALMGFLSNLFGLIIYARYYDCDPLVSGEVQSMDQISPHFAIEVLKGFPGLGGFYIAGIFAATLSTLSSAINSISLIILQDFIKPFRSAMSDEDATKISKILAVLVGMGSLSCVFIFLNFSSGFQAYYSVLAVTAGSSLGLVTLGMLVPFASSLGAAIGCICGSLLTIWIVVGASVYKYIHPYAPLGISGCNETLAVNATLYSTAHYVEHNSSIFPLYTVPFVMYIAIGFCTTLIVGSIASLLTGPQNPDELPKGVIYPTVDKLFRNLPEWLKSRLGYKINITALPEEEMMNIPQKT